MNNIILPLMLVSFVALVFFRTSKVQKQQVEKINTLKVGLIIMTTTGIVGEITKISDAYFEIKTANSNIVILKNAVQSVIQNTEAYESFAKVNTNIDNQNSKIKLEIFNPSSKSKRDKYGF